MTEVPLALSRGAAVMNALAAKATQDRDEWQRLFCSLAEATTVTIGEAVDLLRSGRPSDAVDLLEHVMSALDKAADPVKRRNET